MTKKNNLIDSELSVVCATIKVCLVQLHSDVSAGLTFSPVCLRCCKKHEGRSVDGKRRKIHSFFVTTTAGEDDTSEGNPGNSNGDVVDVAPPVPAPEDEAAAELAAAELAAAESAPR